jgi:hypothetical protein
MVHDTDEIRFSTSGWRCYHVGVLAILAGVTAAACAGEALSLWGGRSFRFPVAYELIFGCVAVALAATTLLAVSANLWEAARTWLRWHQLRQPAVVVSRDGISYQPHGREVTFGWAEIEELALQHYHHGRTVASVYLRLAASPAAPVGGSAAGGLAAGGSAAGGSTRPGRGPRIPGDRILSVGNLDQIDVPTSAAIATLRRLAGSRFATRSLSRAPVSWRCRRPSAAETDK